MSTQVKKVCKPPILISLVCGLGKILEEFFLGHEARMERILHVVEEKVVSGNGKCGENRGEKLIER